jgi:hypothetical protein
MKIREIILEYRTDITIQQQGERLVAHVRDFERQKLSAQEIVTELESCDPTPNKMYMTWLIRQYLARQFRLEDSPRIREVMTSYHRHKAGLPVEQRDVGRLTFYQVEDLADSILNADTTPPAQDQVSSYANIPGLDILYSGPLGVLAVPRTRKASCAIGSGTKWCTSARNNNRFHQYNRQGPLYVWIERPGGLKYQFHWETLEVMDDKNRPISREKLKYFREQNPVTRKLFAQKEQEIMKTPERAYRYAQHVIRGRWPEAEQEFMKTPERAYEYAQYVIKDRWPEAEEAIMQDPYNAYRYARDVIKDRWPEAEEAIMQDPQRAYWYAWQVIRGRWPEAEEVIMQDPRWAYAYAQDVIKGPWPAAGIR